jgi:hypothetical protein
MSIQGQIPFLFVAGKVLSGVIILVLVLSIVDIWRRQSFPELSYGGVSLSQKRLRVVWLLVLIGAFGVGINEGPIAISTRSMEDAEIAAASKSFKTVSVNLPLPFYRYERERVYGDGVLVEEDIAEGFLIPWALLWALLAYVVLVVRWNPESRMARRILRGRKWRREEADHDSKGQSGNS